QHPATFHSYFRRRSLFPRWWKVGANAFEDFGGHADRFGQGRMRVNGLTDVRRISAHLDGETNLADEVTGVLADNAAANDPLRRALEEELGEAFGAVVAKGATRGCPRKQGFAEVHTVLF